MMVARIQSILVVAGFIAFIALSGITLGLAGVSAFAPRAAAHSYMCPANSPLS